MSCEMVLVGALVGASSVRTVTSVMFASENWVPRARGRLTPRNMRPAARRPVGPLAHGKACQRARQGAGAMARTDSGTSADKLGGDLEILWRFQPKPG